MITNLAVELKKAVKVREAGKLIESGKMFGQILKKVKKSNEEYVGVMAEYVIQLRLEGKEKQREAYKLAQELYEYDKESPASVWTVGTVLEDMDNYELAIGYLRKLVKMYPNNSLKQGEAQTHLAHTLLRIGEIEGAVKIVDEALENIRRNTAKEDYVEVRESSVFMVRARLNLAQNNKEQAKSDAEEALAVAEKGGAVFRIRQAQELLKVMG